MLERKVMGMGKRETVEASPVSVLTAKNIRGQKRAGTDPVVAALQTGEISQVPITLRSNVK